MLTLLIFSMLIAVWPGRLEGSSYTYRVQRAIVDETMKIPRDYRLKNKLKNLEAALHMEAARQLAARRARMQAAPAISAPPAGAFQANAAPMLSATVGSS